jgi:hypothetical protein
MTFIAALRVDRIDARINGERFGGVVIADNLKAATFERSSTRSGPD